MIDLVAPTAAPMAGLQASLQISESLYKFTFSDSDWNRIVRASLHHTGEWFVDVRLPLRFTEYARTDLGYDRKQGLTPKNLLAAALADGTIQKLADQFFGGFNPWRLAKVPGPLWKKWIEDGRKAGRYNISVTGTFSGAKRDLRQYVKRQLKAELYAKSQDNPEKFKTPLVATGELRDDATQHSDVKATATASSSKVRISIHDPHAHGATATGRAGGTHPIVGAVMRRMTQAELVQATSVFGSTMDGLINGAAVRPITRGPAAGQIRRSLTQDQRESIAHTILNQRPSAA